jgi:UDP-N-acetylmuramate dehydrogenase
MTKSAHLTNAAPSILEHVALAEMNTFGFAATARFAARIGSEAELIQVLEDPRVANGPVLVLGGGSNVVITRDFAGTVLHMAIAGISVEATPDAWLVTAGAGENWHGFVAHTLAQGMPGLENLALIPGTVGAAPIQNIGAYGVELADHFHSVRALDRSTGTFVTLDAKACAFGYRDSVFKHAARDRYIITAVTFRLPRAWQARTNYGDVSGEIAQRGIQTPNARDIFDAVVAIRSRKLPDPRQIGNAGSFFKNPVVTHEHAQALLARFPALVHYAQADGSVKLAAGWMIDQCGFKGHRVGAVGVFERQALVLVNHGGGTGAELMSLAATIQAAVEIRFGVKIEPEPVVI